MEIFSKQFKKKIAQNKGTLIVLLLIGLVVFFNNPGGFEREASVEDDVGCQALLLISDDSYKVETEFKEKHNIIAIEKGTITTTQVGYRDATEVEFASNMGDTYCLDEKLRTYEDRETVVDVMGFDDEKGELVFFGTFTIKPNYEVDELDY